jgi:hypothetical protein
MVSRNLPDRPNQPVKYIVDADHELTTNSSPARNKIMPLLHSQARRGAVTPLVALCLLLMIPAVVALVVDGGMLLTERRRAQASADAAAMAAACVLYDNYPVDHGQGNVGNPSGAALNVASANGYSNDGTTSSVTVNIPPQSGPYAGLPSYVEVIVTYYQGRAFSSFLGTGTMPVRARAVARGAWTDPNVGVLVLNYSGKGTLDTQGNAAFTEIGAKVIVNSNNPSAALDTGNGTMRAPEFDITGGYTITGGGQMTTSPIPNNIVTGTHPTPDPLAYIPAPSQPSGASVPTNGNFVAPTYTNASYTLPNGTVKTYNNVFVLSPGAYGGPGQPNLPNFTNGDLVIFKQASVGSDGIYYLTSGGLNANSADLIMDPTTSGGIMIYNAGTGTSDGINIAGNSSGYVNLSGPTDGIYTGLMFFQARNAPEDVQIAGNGTFNITGTIYVADGTLKVAGNGAVSNIGSQYVSLDLNITGNGNVGIIYSGPKVARARFLTLVE